MAMVFDWSEICRVLVPRDVVEVIWTRVWPVQLRWLVAMDKAVYKSKQTSVVAIHRPRGNENLGSSGRDPS